MAIARKTSLLRLRKQKRLGFMRVEVEVRGEDESLIRSVAQALGDPRRAAETRSLLELRFGKPPPIGLKELLAAAPLEGIDLDRSRACNDSDEAGLGAKILNPFRS